MNIEEEVKESFYAVGFAGRIGFGERPALVIIDLTKGFTDPSGPLAGLLNVDDAIKANAALLHLCREKGVLVVFISMLKPDEGSPLLKKLKNVKHLRGGWTEVDQRLKPLPTEHIVGKKYSSAFFGTTLTSLLISQRVDTLIITGCVTSGCIRAATVDAISHGFRPIVPLECVTDRHPTLHMIALSLINATSADVLPLKDVLKYLNSLQ